MKSIVPIIFGAIVGVFAVIIFGVVIVLMIRAMITHKSVFNKVNEMAEMANEREKAVGSKTETTERECEFCHTIIKPGESKCSNCGAPINSSQKKDK